MQVTRDDVKWWVGMIGGVLIALAAHLDLFPWIPAGAQHAIEMLAFIAAVASGKFASSPLRGNGENK